MAEATLHCFGVGDGHPSPERGHSSFLYQLDGACLMVDCGDGTSRRYEASGIPYAAFDAMLISHQHADHLGGFPMFIQGLWLARRDKAVPVYMGVDGIEPTRTFLRACYLFDELFKFRLSFHELRSGQTFKVKSATVTPFRTTHLDSLADRFAAKYEQNFDAFSFLIEHGGRRIAHSADIGAPEDLAPLLQEEVDMLVCELAHFAPQELFEFLKGCSIKRLVLTHLPSRLWAEQATILGEARAALPKTEISIGQAGDTIRF